MKDFEKQFEKVDRKRKKREEIRMLFGLGIFGAIGIVAKLILSPKSQKKIVTTIYKDTKNAMDTVKDKSDEVRRIIEHGYRNINRDLHKVASKIVNELE